MLLVTCKSESHHRAEKSTQEERKNIYIFTKERVTKIIETHSDHWFGHINALDYSLLKTVVRLE